MGLFLDLSGIAGVCRGDVAQSLQDYVEQYGGVFERAAGSADDVDSLAVVESPSGNVSVLHRGAFLGWEDVSIHVSRSLRAPVFSLQIYDGDFWLYILLKDGQAVDSFNPLPDYWDETISSAERRHWAGNATIIGRHWLGVTAAVVRNYLVPWDIHTSSRRGREAYPEDRYAADEAWQVSDFMRKLGLTWSMDETGKMRGSTYRFNMPARAS